MPLLCQQKRIKQSATWTSRVTCSSCNMPRDFIVAMCPDFVLGELTAATYGLMFLLLIISGDKAFGLPCVLGLGEPSSTGS